MAKKHKVKISEREYTIIFFILYFCKNTINEQNDKNKIIATRDPLEITIRGKNKHIITEKNLMYKFFVEKKTKDNRLNP